MSITQFLLFILTSACASSEEAIPTVGGKSYTQTELKAMERNAADYTKISYETTPFKDVSPTKPLEDAGLLALKLH